MKFVTVVFCFFLSLQLYAVDKTAYDLRAADNSLAKSGEVMGNGHFSSKTFDNNFLSYSLLLGGYFTLGTTKGLSAGPFDDANNLTFGHPYALTSFPFFSVDGQWEKLDQSTSEWSNLAPEEAGRLLKVEADVRGLAHVTFQLEAGDDGSSVNVTLMLKNIDTRAHQLGLGLVYDPSLGQWEDGFLRLNGQLQDRPNEVQKVALPNSFELSERQQQPFGLRLAGTFVENKPDRFIVANWADAYTDPGLDFTPLGLPGIYDLMLKMLWNERTIEPGAEIGYRLSFALQEPDFSSPVFMRWDMPAALSLENNVLFPGRLNTTVRVMNPGSGANNLALELNFAEPFTGTNSMASFNVGPSSSAYPSLFVTTAERYENLVLPLTVTCKQNGNVLDSFTRNVFLPATPVSDEGLTVSIDSLIAAGYPNVSIVFKAENEATGTPLLNLHKENVFLYDNGQRIPDFTMEKFSGGGSQLADVCFVLDCSGSMGDNIADVRNNLGEFADSLRACGYDFRVAVVTFSTTVDDVWDFTNDIELMKQRLAGVDLWGGIENSPAALYKASELSWRPGSKRNIIWITDEPYPEDLYTKEQVVNRMLAMDIRVHGVGLLELQTDWFNPIVIPTGGNFYNIFGNFRDVLLDVARMKSQDRYIASFKLNGNAPHNVELKIHYAGLGGQANITINGAGGLAKNLRCYPNPFNPVIRIAADTFDGADGQVDIYNVLGQRVRHFALSPSQANEIVWNALDDHNLPVGAGFYIVRLTTRQADGQLKQESQKILYLK